MTKIVILLIVTLLVHLVLVTAAPTHDAQVAKLAQTLSSPHQDDTGKKKKHRHGQKTSASYSRESGGVE